MKKKALTLTEIMITLTVIGVLTAVLLPSAIHSTPDEKILKFKKAHKTLYKVISELLSSDKYYCNGDLGMKKDGVDENGKDICTLLTNNSAYFCKTFADLISIKSIDCNKTDSSNVSITIALRQDGSGTIATPKYNAAFIDNPFEVTQESINKAKSYTDKACKERANKMRDEIVSVDGIVYYELGAWPFGKSEFPYYGYDNTNGEYLTDTTQTMTGRIFAAPGTTPMFRDKNGYDIVYKVFCIDIDGIPEGTAGSTNCDDKKDVCPFGYGIRADGKILPGVRADEWTKKPIQQRE